MKRQRAHQADVLRVLGDHGRAMSAYEILDELKKSDERLAPATVYRALAALLEQGCAYRIESANAFVLRRSDHVDRTVVLSFCGDCRAVEEHAAPEVMHSLSKIARLARFTPSRHVIELQGTCSACAAGREASA